MTMRRALPWLVILPGVIAAAIYALLAFSAGLWGLWVR
jgi:hypothetical protein